MAGTFSIVVDGPFDPEDEPPGLLRKIFEKTREIARMHAAVVLMHSLQRIILMVLAAARGDPDDPSTTN